MNVAIVKDLTAKTLRKMWISETKCPSNPICFSWKTS